MTTPVTDRLAIARAAYNDVPLYDPKRTPVELDLSDNTNLWGVPPNAARVIRDFAMPTITRYPTLYGTELKRALADHAGVTPDMVVTGCGSDDILDSAMRAFGNEADIVAATDPTFAMVPIFARMNALRSTLVTELPDHEVDADALLAAGAKVIYLCSPNNPTGALVARRTLEHLIDSAAGVLLIDEAYTEFAGVSNIDLLARSPRVMLIRTMSKAFGLAGLRVPHLCVPGPNPFADGDRDDASAIGTERDPLQLAPVIERRGAGQARDGVPDARGLVARTGDDAVPAWRKVRHHHA